VSAVASKRALLAGVPLFAGLGPGDLDSLVAAVRSRRVAARSEVFHERDDGSQVYVIGSGRLKALTTSADGDDVVFSIMGPGEVFGELGFLGGGPRTLTVVALEPCELLVLDRRDLLPLLRSRPEVALQMLGSLGERLRRIDRFVKDTMFLNLPTRLARKLVDLAARHGEAVADGVRIDLRLSQEDLGDLVAATRESVNKQLKDWREAGLVSMESGYVTLREPAKLADLAALSVR
jgi:CRP-like cAMP-binding protein